MKLNKTIGLAASKGERLEYYSNICYEVRVKHKDDEYYVRIPELSLVASDRELAVAFEELTRQKQKYLKQMVEAETEDEIILPAAVAKRDKVLSELKMFACKTIIVVVVMSMGMIVSASVVINKITDIPVVDIGKNIIKRIEGEVNAPEDIQKRRLSRLKEELKKVEPIIAIVRESLLEGSKKKERGEGR